jgi:segregation and condensation protein B
MSNEKNKIEALLFASAKRMTVEDIAKITGLRDLEKIKTVLGELKIEIESRGASMVLGEENGYWKLTVKDHYMPMLNKILKEAELDRPLMETLAVVAWKYPVLQADVVKIRHNKAYDHLKHLEELGFISRYRFGRTNKITLTDKFFTYFDLPTKEQAKEVFKSIVPEKVREKVEKAEEEIDEAERKIEDAKRKKEEMKKAKKEAEKASEEGEEDKKEESSPEPVKPEVSPQPEPPKPEIKEEDQNVSIKMPEVQEPDEVSEPKPESASKE